MNISKQQAAFYTQWLAHIGVKYGATEKPVNFYQRSHQQSKTPKTNSPLKPNSIKTSPIITQSESMPKSLPLKTSDTLENPILQAVAAAHEVANHANSLAQLKNAMTQFDGCELKKTARHLVFADGYPQAHIMFIGEAPGEQEDRQAKPFVGRAGQLLDKMLAAIALDRSKVYITNILPWRPPANRNPSPEERAICRPFLDKHITLVQPKILVLLGAIAAKEMLATSQGITRLRGQWHSVKIGTQKYLALPTLHPAYLLRQPSQKAAAWQDMLMLKEKYLAGL